jgi:hypothetical protein
MNTCMICGDTFTEATMGGPAEPCECGHQVGRDEWQSMDDARFARLQDAWIRRKARQDAAVTQ